MRSEQQMLDLLLSAARDDERIRAVILNGSRANPNAPRDFFQDFDVVYLVTDPQPFRNNYAWIRQFGELMILQEPDDMASPPAEPRRAFAYLMQFADGNRIDLTIYPIDELARMAADSETIVLLDKDGILAPHPPPSDGDYLPKPPGARDFFECCNEFWWVSPYVAKGLWRRELPYARHMLDGYVRPQLDKMLVWHIGLQTGFSANPGKLGKYFEKYLSPPLWDLLLKTYAGGSYQQTWDALFAMIELFRAVAVPLAGHFGFAYPHDDDRRVSAHLRHVRALPRDAKEMYP